MILRYRYPSRIRISSIEIGRKMTVSANGRNLRCESQIWSGGGMFERIGLPVMLARLKSESRSM